MGLSSPTLSGFGILRELPSETVMDDRELLDEFVKARSQAAFCELVTRHLPVVYSAARRMVRDSHLAEEVAQSVFTTLAQKAEMTLRGDIYVKKRDDSSKVEP